MPEIVSIGECMIELFSEQPLGESETFQRSLAGDSLNILVAAARLGTTTGYITRVGKDPFTSYLLNTWRAEGIDVSHAREEEGFNAVHFVAQLPGGDREFVYYRKGSAASTMQPSDLDPDYIASAKVLHISGITQAISASARATALRAAQIASEHGVAVSYDPNYRHQLWSHEEARRGMDEVMPYVSYFLPSVPADSEALLGTSDARRAVEIGRDRGASMVVATSGEAGATVGVGDEVFEVDAYTAGPVVDTTGAGDAFKGAMLHGLLRGMSTRDAATLGAIAAGLKIRGRGALTTMPSGKEVYAAFDSLPSNP
jgi:2-dehydro-3-deoxygluconokinase